MAARTRPASRRSPRLSAPPLSTYWEATREPLYSLVFLLPLVATYEFGALLLRVSTPVQHELVAQQLLRTLLGWFGAGGLWLPGLALLITLLLWHVLSHRPWQIRAWVPLLMAGESVLLVLPLLAIHLLPLQAGDGPVGSLAERIVLALGAGIYEELLFRLGLISLLLFVLGDLLRLPRRAAAPIALLLAAAIFALCHYHPVGVEIFSWSGFLQRLVAGAYLSLIFLSRGLGIATGCHSGYNLLILVLGT